MPIYCLAIHPGKSTLSIFSEIKSKLRSGLGKYYGSVNSQAHMTLILFVASEEDYPQILEEFRRVLISLAPFDIDLKNFGDFSSAISCIFYAKPAKASAIQIRKYCRIIEKKFDKTIKKKCNDWQVRALISPHMTIARELTREEISLAYKLFANGFLHSFSCSSFAIRKFNELIGQYEVIDEIPFLGGRQMRLSFC